MNRADMLAQLKTDRDFDIIIVGGGATGLGCAVDAANRGYRTLLLEQEDFAKGTSSRSTKLVHGGVRYLQQGNIALVREALRERGRMYVNAPHLVGDLQFIVPRYAWWEGPFYGVGLKLYDVLAGKLNFGKSRLLSPEKTLELIPNLEDDGLQGGVVYHDGQFDDARMALALALTAADEGACVINHARMTGLLKRGGLVEGVRFEDRLSGDVIEVHAKVVINATGIFTDTLRTMDDADAGTIVRPSSGVHIVLDGSFLSGKTAIMVPHTDDGRVLFAIPWHGKALVGTTDTPREAPALEPLSTAEEVGFILRNANRYLERDPTEADILSTFSGLRPLVSKGGSAETKTISRKHEVIVSASGLVTVVGGKWTTYRQMAEDTIDEAIGIGTLPESPCGTVDLKLHGWVERSSLTEAEHHYRWFGSDAAAVHALEAESPEHGERLHPRLPYTAAHVIWALRHEMAHTVEDVLSRRTRALLLDARAASECAGKVATLMASALGHDAAWIAEQTSAFQTLCALYLPAGLEG